MKIKLDEKYLNAIKNKLIASLKSSPKVIECMNSGSISFYLENLKETRDAAMMSFSTHISIDKSFFDFDDNGYVLGFKKSKTKIIRSQLGHELLHAASGNREYSGLNKLSDDKKRGLNEGITQMYTEDVFGYVVSHFSDGYRDYKKIAKIIRLCVGDDPVKKSYFEHTNDLDIACANLSGDYAFFDELNQILTDLYYMKKIAKKASKAGKIELKKIYYERVKVSFASVIVNLVVPKLKSIKSADERRNFIKSIFLVIDDDINIVRMVRNLMINELSMSPEELEREKTKL